MVDLREQPKCLRAADDKPVVIAEPVHLDSQQPETKGITMIHQGDTLTNPVTGETLIFHRTSKESGGESVLVETIVQPDGFVAAAHVHPHQSERFEVLEGELGVHAGNKRLVARPGTVINVPAGTPHRFYNAGERPARFLCEVRPALGFESLIETMFTLAADGKTNRRGMPNPLRLAVIARAHFDTVRLPVVPALAQRAALAVGALVGRLLGYKPSYSPAAPRVALATT